MRSGIGGRAKETLRNRDELLGKIQERVLWLSMQMIHHANNVRENPDGMKVGGHQTSSASVVTILTSLLFEYMKAGDRLAVKPHASPVFHAIQFLLGNLDQDYLKTLRQFHGLQAYPSRTKDPDPVDFSTGSVGLGAIAPNFAALAEHYVRARISGDVEPPHRFIALVGDAELDEGSVWEAVVEPQLAKIPNILWVVDLNRQSLDRIIPGIRVQLWRAMFSANGWCVIDAKFGTRLEAAFQQPRGELLRECIDDMPNEAYQRLLRLPAGALREWLPRYSKHPKDLRTFIKQWDDQELRDLYQNLGGHDFATLRSAFSEADNAKQPCVVFAYTLKGWQLPSVGDPQNHQVLLTQEQMDTLQAELGVTEVWPRFAQESQEGKVCKQRGEELRSGVRRSLTPPDLSIPPQLGRPYRGRMSTQQAFGLILVDVARDLPALAERIVTVSPDVASSTNLGGWINKVGVWTQTEGAPLPEDGIVRSLRWEETPRGQHIELGISEGNLFMSLGQLGLASEMTGELLFPIGTLYDPFVCRALESLLYNLYAGARFMIVGTPSGITLSAEGGAHQSFITPSIGIGMPEVSYYEPCFAQELEWIMLAGLEQIRRRECSSYLRLTTRRIDQSLFRLPEDVGLQEHLRRQVLTGAYRLRDLRGEAGYRPGDNVVHIMASGAVVPEALEASQLLQKEGVFANVVNVTSADLLFRRYQESVYALMGAHGDGTTFLADVIPQEERVVPIVTVIDGHPHALAWIGSALGTKVFPLGVSQFGQSGTMSDLYREYQMDAGSIAAASFELLEAGA